MPDYTLGDATRGMSVKLTQDAYSRLLAELSVLRRLRDATQVLVEASWKQFGEFRVSEERREVVALLDLYDQVYTSRVETREVIQRLLEIQGELEGSDNVRWEP